MYHSTRTHGRVPQETPEWAMGFQMEKETFRLLYDHRSLQRMESIQRTQAVEVRSSKMLER